MPLPPVPTDDFIIEEVRREGGGVPAASYLQRRYQLPYVRAARLRELLAALELVHGSPSFARAPRPVEQLELAAREDDPQGP